MSHMYPTDPPQYDDGEGGFTFVPQTEIKWQFTEESKDVIRELADEVIDDLRTEVIELRERAEELERQVNARREPSGTPAGKADSLPVRNAQIEAVLQLCRDMHAAYERDPHGDVIAYELERAIEEAA